MRERVKDTYATLQVATKEKTTKSGSGYMQMTLAVTKTSQRTSSNLPIYSVSCIAKWLITPENRKTDILFVNFNNANLVNNSYSAEYYCSGKNYYNQTSFYSKQYTEGNGLMTAGGGILLKFDLKNDSSSATVAYPNRWFYSGHTAYISFKLGINSKSATSFGLDGVYIHQKSTVSIAPSISYDGSAVSGSFSVELDNHFICQLSNHLTIDI